MRRPRPGPLQELPLELFMPPNPNIPSKSRPNKRPLSPGGPSLFSPTKRRILNDEGIFSPEKTLKGSIYSRGTPARFSEILSGPASPAKKLDFGVPKPQVESSNTSRSSTRIADVTPTRAAPSSNRLAPSPEFKPKPQSTPRQHDIDKEMDDYFGYPNPSSSSHLTIAPTITPSEMPPPPNPQSIHYPGFCVYYDVQTPSTPDEWDAEAATVDKDVQKENIAPRRKPRKAVTTPNTDLKSQIFSPEAKKRELERASKAKSMPATPKKVLGGDRLECAGSPTPRRDAVSLVKSVTASTPRLIEKDRREMRKVMQDEVEQFDSDEEDGSTL